MTTFLCDIDDIDIVLDEKILEPYVRQCQKEMAAGIDKTMKVMVATTKETANVDDGRWESLGFPKHRNHGTFKKAITWKKKDYPMGHSATWYLRSPEYRLAHLLVHGHEQFIFGRPTGKRTPGSTWLQEARDEAERNLEKNIRDEIGGAG